MWLVYFRGEALSFNVVPKTVKWNLFIAFEAPSMKGSEMFAQESRVAGQRIPAPVNLHPQWATESPRTLDFSMNFTSQFAQFVCNSTLPIV